MLRASLVFAPCHRVHVGQTFAPLGRGWEDPLFRQVAGAGGPVFWATARVQGVGLVARFSRGVGLDAGVDPLLAPVEVEAWTDAPGPRGAAALESFLESAPAWVGEGDSWASLYASEAWMGAPAWLREARAQHPGLRLPSIGLLGQNLVLAVSEQRVTGLEAMAGIRAILRQYGDLAPATGHPDQPRGMRVFPSPATLAGVPSWDWHRAGYDSARSSTILRVAQRLDSLEKLAADSPVREVALALNSIPGLGPWTIAETLQRYCGHPDAISVGDFHLAHHVGYAFEGVRGDDARMLALLAPYAGHRQRIVALLKAAGIQAPRRGPRLSPQDHRGH